MELNGALSNPLVSDKKRLARLVAVKQMALERPGAVKDVPSAGRRQGVVLDSVTTVLERAREPMALREICLAVAQLLEEPVPISSIRQALSAHADRGDRRFRRIRRGCYELTARR